MRRIFYLMRQYLKRKRFRAAVMTGGIVLACATLFCAAILSKGIQDTLRVSRERLGADIVAVPAEAKEEAQEALISGSPTSFYMPAALEDKVRRVKGVGQTCAQVYLRSLDSPCCVVQVALVGYDPARDFTINPWTLLKSSEPLRNNQIIVGAKVISAVVGTPVKAIGQRLMFLGKPFSVAAILEPTGLGADYTVFINMDVAYDMVRDSPLYPIPLKKDQISAILIKVEEGLDPEKTAQDIEREIPELKALTAAHLTGSFSLRLRELVNLLFAAGAFFSLLALILAGSLFTLSVRQRMRELGLFMAMGARRAFIFRLIILEAACIAGGGGLLGVLAGLGATALGKNLITNMMGNLYMWPDAAYFAGTAAVTVAAALLTGLLGGLYPARSISGMEPYEAIRKGE
jgi:putative ABC transport system permease protein